MRFVFGTTLLSVTGSQYRCLTATIPSYVLPGYQHSKQRKILNPIFSISNMRNMLPIFYEISYKASVTTIPTCIICSSLFDHGSSYATALLRRFVEAVPKLTFWVGWAAPPWNSLVKVVSDTHSTR